MYLSYSVCSPYLKSYVLCGGALEFLKLRVAAVASSQGCWIQMKAKSMYLNLPDQ